MLDKFQEAFNKLIEKLEGWMEGLVLGLPNFILAILVMGFSVVFVRYLRKWLKKGMGKVSANASINDLIANIGTIIFTGIALFITLGILNLDKALTSLLAGAGVVGLAVGLALQDPIVNTFSGVILSIRKFYNIGDWVNTNGYAGFIEQINLRTTVLRQPDGTRVIMPNKLVIENPLENFNLTNQRLVVVNCGVHYDDDLHHVKAVTLESIKDEFEVVDSDIDFFFTEFGNSSINFELRFLQTVNSWPAYRELQSRAIMTIKKAFDSEGITIPFPIRTLDFDSEKLGSIFECNFTTVRTGKGEN